MTELIEHLKRLKKEKDLTFLQMAIDIGVTPDTVMRWWRGERKPSRMAKRLIISYLRKHGIKTK